MPDLVDVTTAEPEAVAAEMARRQALKVMGIASYVSRYDLPGAAPALRRHRGKAYRHRLRPQ